MAAHERVRFFANEAEYQATATGRADFRVAARHLHALADHLQRLTEAERTRKRRRRGGGARLEESAPEPTESGETWTATRRTRTKVTLERTG